MDEIYPPPESRNRISVRAWIESLLVRGRGSMIHLNVTPDHSAGSLVGTDSLAQQVPPLRDMTLCDLSARSSMLRGTGSTTQDAAFSSLLYLFALSACACRFDVTVTSVSLPPFMSRRGLFNTNQRLSLSLNTADTSTTSAEGHYSLSDLSAG